MERTYLKSSERVTQKDTDQQKYVAEPKNTLSCFSEYELFHLGLLAVKMLVDIYQK